MLEKRKEYIDQLLSDLKLLEQRLLSVKESDTLPFSFFSASFDRVEKISRSLHELELMQIGEMKEQMERLVRFLSESDVRNSAAGEPTHEEIEEMKEETRESREKTFHDESEFIDDKLEVEQIEKDQTESDIHSDYSEQSDYPEQPEYSREPEQSPTETDRLFTEQERVGNTERIILPEYRDPRISETVSFSHTGTEQTLSKKNGAEKTVTRSLNDIIQGPPTLLDLKRNISLNDRFLFQRELFNNNREEMNRVMDKLNTFGNFEEAESYLRNERNWNFEERTVKEFLLIIKKGFE